MPLHPDSWDITTFTADNAMYRYKVLSFGLSISPNSFSRMMRIAFSGLSADRNKIYIDDIRVPGKSEAEHLMNLEKKFQVRRDRNLKINPDKSNFFRTEIFYIGYLCTNGGIKMDLSKLALFSIIHVQQTRMRSSVLPRWQYISVNILEIFHLLSSH